MTAIIGVARRAMIDQDERVRLAVVRPHHERLELIGAPADHGRKLEGFVPNSLGPGPAPLWQRRHERDRDQPTTNPAPHLPRPGQLHRSSMRMRKAGATPCVCDKKVRRNGLRNAALEDRSGVNCVMSWG
jgi:hypothetical protein